MQYAVLGNGFIFPRHKNAIEATGGTIALTCDIDPAKGADFTDWVEMFHHPKFDEIQAVSICLPNYMHSVVAREALALGKRVLCEKPLTIFEDYGGLKDVNVVLQLRKNPVIDVLKSRLTGGEDVEVFVKVYRESKYWDGWKGDANRSGGVLFNMGVHYIDLLVHLFGDSYFIGESFIDKYMATGTIEFPKNTAKFHIELSKEPCETERYLKIDGTTVELVGATIELKDGQPTPQDLHTEVYRDFIEGRGVKLDEAKKSLELVRKLINHAHIL